MIKIKQVREAKNVTQETLSELTGLRINTISRIENGKNKPHGSTLRVIAIALKVQVKDLV